MLEFHDYSQFVIAAYLASTLILSRFATFCFIHFKRNEISLQKIQSKNKSKKTTKN